MPPPWTPPPLLPLQSLGLTATILIRRLRRQEDLSLKVFGPPWAGTIGEPWEEGGPSQTPLPPLEIPPPPPLPPPSNTPLILRRPERSAIILSGTDPKY